MKIGIVLIILILGLSGGWLMAQDQPKDQATEGRSAEAAACEGGCEKNVDTSVPQNINAERELGLITVDTSGKTNSGTPQTIQEETETPQTPPSQ